MKKRNYTALISFLFMLGCGGGENGSTENAPISIISTDTNRSTEPFYPAGTVLDDSGNALPTLRRTFKIENGGQSSITVDINNASITYFNPQLTITDNNADRTRTSIMVGPIQIRSASESETGQYKFEGEQSFAVNADNLIVLSSFDFVTSIQVNNPEFGVYRKTISMNIVPDTPTIEFMSRNDLHELVGTTTQIDVSSSTLTGEDVTFDGEFGTDRREINARIPAQTGFYTVSEFLEQYTVGNNTFRRVAVVEYLRDELNPITSQTEPVTTTYYLAQGIGMIKSENLTNFYGQNLGWELVSID